MQESACYAIAEFIAVLSNPFRIRILCVLLNGEHSVGEIAHAVGLSPAHTSSHLRVLYDRGYLKRRREWKRVYYALRDPSLRAFLDAAAELATGTSSKESH